MLSKKQRRLKKKVRERHQDLSEETKSKKCQYACKLYRNRPEGEIIKKNQCGRKRYKDLPEDEK